MKTNQAAWPLRVLVVDDDRDTANSFAILLKLWGHYPLVAYRSVDALQMSGDQRPDVVLLDIGLPGIDGYEVARRVRRQPGMAEAFLIAVTGYGQPGDYELSREAGFDLHLLKPVEPEELHEALAGARARPEDTGLCAPAPPRPSGRQIRLLSRPGAV
ncbi:MAG TPA: response regulator [Gemmataceae bacterium]|jgi:CheY-like chemotaxis protein|nr:response regulator [Gemmataceae bacterium]